MDLLNVVRIGAASVVVIDDLFAGPDFTHIPAESKHALLDAIEGNARDKAALQAALEADSEDDQQLVENAVARADDLWALYSKNPDENLYLQALFSTFELEHAEIIRLKQLVEYLSEFFGQEPKIFSSLEAAGDELSHCAVAFIDLFMSGAQTINAVLELHAGYNAQYRGQFRHEEAAWPKFIVLMSTRIPDEEHLRSFRQGAGIRSAFFRSLDKRRIEREEIERILSAWSIRYAAAAGLNRYLNDLSEVVTSSADRVIQDIDRIELHDLAILDAARLLADGSSLHSYISWLTSELLASRARMRAAERASSAPSRAADGAVDTNLVKESVLFDLFADITNAPAEASGHPQFGEIIARKAEINAANVPVFVALSPACDLARCSADYEVLLLRGDMTASGRTAAELLQLGAVFGKGKHLLKYRVGDDDRQGVIKWNTKTGLITRPAGTLADENAFIRLGRMAELFAYEVKEIAISQVSRVGLPVAPSVQRAGSVLVRVKFDLGIGITPLEFRENAPALPTVCALITMGRVGDDGNEAEVVMLTEQFREWLNESVLPNLRERAGNTRIDALLHNIANWNEWHVKLDGKSGKPDFNDFVVRIVNDEPTNAARGLEILVTPA